MATLKGDSTTDIHGLAVKANQDYASGLYDLLINNTVNLDASGYLGTDLTYSENFAIEKPVIKTFAKNNTVKFIAASYMSPFDLAVNLYGDIERLLDVLPYCAIFDQPVTPGTEISVDVETEWAKAMVSKIVQTDRMAYGADVLPGNLRLLEDGTARLLEDGTFRLLEI